MATYLTIAEARAASGLRLVVTAHVPGLWSEACKSIFDAKKFPYRLAEQVVGGENRELLAWTAQTSGPVAIWNDERPRSSWLEQLLLAERLAPQVPLLPSDMSHRMEVIGLCHELCSDRGFGWNMRLRTVHRLLTSPNAEPASRQLAEFLASKYGYDPDWVEPARQQQRDLIVRLRDMLRDQQASGRDVLVGDRLSAVDVYWAVIAGSIDPLPEALCPNMPSPMRASYTDPELRELAGAALMAHRDRIYRDHLKLPMDF